MQSQRSQRVGEAIHKEISALLVKGLKDPRVGFVTLTGVEVTRDLSIARVFYTVLGDEKVQRETTAGLVSSIPFLRRELGKRLRTRIVPEIIFQFDQSIAYGNRIEELIREIKTEATDDSGDPEGN